MPRLSIKNIGPIKEVDIILNKINLIIGPQSSGKSTINKIACYCTWVEKTVSLAQSFEFFMKDNSFLDNLVNFHKLKGYFREDSYIEYESNVVRFSYLYSENLPHFEWIDKYGYIRPKISYIPAERNIVSMISDWGQVNLPNNNIFNFMSDWNVARKLYTYDHNLPIDYIGAKYFYDENSDMDFLETEDGNRIQLINASSGQQSLTPLFVLIKYFTEEIY
ncbi:MAG: AAA family ATPase, partial [Bacteroidetes bacterium]|nr:AAA family ATPase [Candidatus Cryptobacteroides excrementavium]